MTCFVAIQNDRHTDTEVTVFSTQEKAIEWAKAKIRADSKSNDLDEVMTEPMIAEGWIYFGSYSPEGDYIFVVSCDIDEHEPNESHEDDAVTESGLTPEERFCSDLLVQFWNAYVQLPSGGHASEKREVSELIHGIQGKLSLRISRRDYPGYWR